jgi:glutathione S-transferase
LKLYEAALSPFAARVRVQIYAKGLDIALVPAPGGPGSDEYKRINPTGKIPALALDDGSVLPESNVIAEYLEDRFPEPSLRPADPKARAQMRLLVALGDQYLFPALHDLYPQVLDPTARDQRVIDAGLANLAPRYDMIERWLAPDPYALGPQLTLADAALFPIFFFATRIHPLLGSEDPTASRPALGIWWKGVSQHPVVQKVDAELAKALAAMMAAR